MSRFYCMYREYTEPHNPAPVHPEKGVIVTPPILVWEILATDPPTHVEMGEIHAPAGWESPDSEQNKAALAFAERICHLLNTRREVLALLSETQPLYCHQTCPADVETGGPHEALCQDMQALLMEE